ncbi:Mg-protoporphyrin IX methyl transferase [Thalassoglobus neptunius]|uniref:Mg-protoporphyrin IX methyl transferase n=2 Tax=Thalassoglobus neptunius TaxID=1938619 RepID=A0A5C5X3L6_9PLAN|nr:Mg-protoporphyrin IX methyl transferase [Thalassoglobus neptunius]
MNSQVSELKLQSQLRETYSADIVRAAMTLIELRERAQHKFSRASEMWFDRTGLEQATPEAVANYKAARFENCAGPIFDLCCGIGSDSIAIASIGKEVTSVDMSEAACLRTRWNAEAHNVDERIETICSDVQQLKTDLQFVHCDPDRRAMGKRSIRLEDSSPPLEFLKELIDRCQGGAIKLSPASNFGGKFDDAEIELISLNGECKEATVWFGDLAGEENWRATLLPSGFTLSADPFNHFPRVGPLSDYIYDVDPAIVRAGLVDALADELELERLDDAEEYLTGPQLVDSPAVTPFRVLAELTHNRKSIRKYFRDHPCHELEIKCRHVPVDVDSLRKSIPLKGTGKKTLLIVRLGGKTKGVAAERIVSEESSASRSEKTDQP